MRAKILDDIDAWDRNVVRAMHAKMQSRAVRGVVIALTFLGYGWNWLAPYPSAADVAIVVVLGVLALGVAASRVFLAVHYPTDVIPGALLGAACAVVGAHVPQ